MYKRRLLKVSVLFLVLLALAAVLIPWKKWIEQQLLSELAARGFSDVHFTVAGIGLSGVSLTDIRIGAPFPLTVSEATLAYQMSELRQGKGQWHIQKLVIKDSPIVLPELEGRGGISLQRKKATITGEFKSADDAYKIQWNMEYDSAAPEKSVFTLTDATIPFNEGRISTHHVLIPLNGKHPIRVKLEVEKISIDALLQSLTNHRASATGIVSGTLPITVSPDGVLTIDQGTLQAQSPGTLSMAPDVIPGDNEKITLVREILKNLHYKILSITLHSDKNNKLNARLALEGSNPEVYEGKPVKLNVNLSGDVLDLIQQSLIMTDPKKLLQQRENEKR